MLRDMFPNGRFSAPATEAEILLAEDDLGVRLPDQLRRLYLECDGFREDLGNSKYLLSLQNEDSIGSLVGTTIFYWDAWEEYQPDLDFRPFVFFGSSCCDYKWAINCKQPNQIIAYHHHMGNKYEIVGSDILELYRYDYSREEVREFES